MRAETGVEGTTDEPTRSTRDRILRESSRLFAERGYHGTSTREIADAVGIRQPSLFHHFAAKRDIMAALQELEFEPSLQLLRAAVALEAGGAARLYFAVYVEVRRLLSSEYVFTGTTAAAVLNDPAFAEGKAAYDRIQRAQTELVAQGIATGELIDIDPAISNRALDWTIEGVLVDASRTPDLDPEALAESLTSFVVRSLLVDPGRLGDVRSEAARLIDDHDRAVARSWADVT